MTPENREFVKAILAGCAVGCVLLVIGFADAGERLYVGIALAVGVLCAAIRRAIR